MNSDVPPTSQSPSSDGDPRVRWERAGCVVCGADENSFFLLAEHLTFGGTGTARIVRCNVCGHLYRDPRPTADTIGYCYTDQYGPHAAAEQPPESPESPAGDSGPRPWYLAPWFRTIPGPRRLYYWLDDRHAAPVPEPPRPEARALEIGCGNGGYLDRLRQAGWHVEGIEPADSPAAHCRARGLDVTTGGIETIERPAGSYDLVVAWMVIEHLHDPAAALRRIGQWLKPGGKLLISVPNIACWELRAFGGYHFILNEPTHLNHFSAAGIQRLLQDNGFRVTRLAYQENLYNVVATLGIWFQARFPNRSIGKSLLKFCDQPSMWGRLLLALPAKLLAAIRQTGRITVTAEPQEPEDGT